MAKTSIEKRKKDTKTKDVKRKSGDKDILNKSITKIESLLSPHEAEEWVRFDTHGSLRLQCLFWDQAIIKDSAPVLITNIAEKKQGCSWEEAKKSYSDLTLNLIEKIKDKANIDLKTVKEFSIMLYYWTPMSHIPWHNDGHVGAGMTIYLNEYWDKDWGGSFMYEEPDDNNTIKAIYPEQGNAVIQRGGVLHHVSPTSKNSAIRVTLQLFITE